MRLADLRPCDHCGGAINPVFYRVTVEQHVIDQRAANAFAGVDRIFGGMAPGLALAMSPDGHDSTQVLTSATVILCTACYCEGSAIVIEVDKRSECS